MAARIRSDLPAIGFTGAVTAISVSILDQFLPSQASKSLVVLVVGLGASILWFELLSLYLRLRLKQERAGLENLLKDYKALDSSFEQVMQERIRYLTDQDAPKKRINELEAGLDQFRAQYTQLFSKIRIRISHIIDQVSD
jgi:hypothetical protein